MKPPGYGVLVAAALLMMGGVVGAEESLNAVPEGAVLYRRYCASCHGSSGTGDGPDATAFASPPRNLREGFLDKYSTDDLVRRVLEGKRLVLVLDLAGMRRHGDQVEAIVAHMRRIPDINWEVAGAGWDRYIQRCQPCHGLFGDPGEQIPPGSQKPRNLADASFQGYAKDEDLIRAIRHGLRGMPALTPPAGEIEARVLLPFVRVLSPGFELYTRYCANCHGDDGRGGLGVSGGSPVPGSLVFDRDYFNRSDPLSLRDNVWHMLQAAKPSMPHLRGSLDERQARTIIEYLKSMK